jgi:hypothetical protein
LLRRAYGAAAGDDDGDVEALAWTS